MSRPCKICSAATVYQGQGRPPIYCPDCRAKRKEDAERERQSRHIEYRRVHTCAQCGAEFYAGHRKTLCDWCLTVVRQVRATLPRARLVKDAYRLYRKALRDGDLVRPNKCQECDRGGRPIQGHHTDYARPLDVIWLCAVCHAFQPRYQERRAAKQQAAE